MNESPIFIGTWKVGDRYPFPYFQLFENKFDLSQKRMVRTEMDLSGSFTTIRLCARHSSNNSDIKDHANNDIYSSITPDVDGWGHYEWATNDLAKPGKYYAILEFERTDGKIFHSQVTWYFTVEQKNIFGKISTAGA
jgi:hypothetical protein